MSLNSKVGLLLITSVASLAMLAGCGHSEANVSTATITLGAAAETNPSPSKTTEPEVVPASANEVAAVEPESAKTPTENTSAAPVASTPPTNGPANDEARTFKVEGPENSIRVSFDDVDLLKVMNLDPVPADAPERLPKWLKELDGKRIRVRGFMFPPFQDTDIRGFVLARDNQICCFGRTPKEYDLVEIFMRKGVSTHYIQSRPFDVVGVFRIKPEIEKYSAMYEMEDAIVIEK